MAFGLQIFNSKNAEVVGGSQNCFALDEIYKPTSSGNKSYTLGAGESLFAFPSISWDPTSTAPALTGLTISGNTISWSVTSQRVQGACTIMVYKRGVV